MSKISDRLKVRNSPTVYQLLESKARQVEIAAEAGLPLMPTYLLGGAQRQPGRRGSLPASSRITRTVRPRFKAKLVGNGAEALAIARAMTSQDGRIIAAVCRCAS
jgi:hypothetical protein